MTPSHGKRLIVVGMPCSGKSTLAESLAIAFDARYIELDALHWQPGWNPVETSVFHERIRAEIATESWVLAGNYFSRQQDVSWSQADTIVWLDLHLSILVRRCVRRSWQRWRSQELLFGSENTESIRDHLKLWDTDKSLVAYIIRYHRDRRHYLEARMTDPTWSHLTFIRLRNPTEIADWHADVRASLKHHTCS